MPGYSQRAGGGTVSLVTGMAGGRAAAATGRGPCLLIGGTADKVRDGRLARSLTPHVLKIDRADHGMLVPGYLSESATVLG
jgi:hypothetical protein